MRWILLAILLPPAVRAEQAPPNMEKYYCLYRVGSLEEARKLAEGGADVLLARPPRHAEYFVIVPGLRHVLLGSTAKRERATVSRS